MSLNLKTKDLPSACEVLGIEYQVPVITNASDDRIRRMINYDSINLLADAINKESNFVPDWSNPNQDRYEARFRKNPGVGWVCIGYGLWHAHSIVGPRLVFVDYKHAEYFGDLVCKMNLIED